MGYRSFVAVSLTVLLAACGSEEANLGTGGGGTTPPASTTTISGVAAVGAAISGANISAKCRNSTNTFTSAAPTTSNGSYGIVVPSNAFPCAIRSSGGTAAGNPASTLHSFVPAGGGTTANITPLTDLITALALKNGASQNDINAWFNSAQGSTALNDLAASLNSAQPTLITALTTQGFTTTGLPNPFTGSITPGSNTDPYDTLLEALQDALGSTPYATLLSNFVSNPGTALPDPAPVTSGGLAFSISNLTASSITIVVNGTLSATEPTLSRNMLYLHAPGNWITYAKPASSDTVSILSPAGSPISGKTVAVAIATDSAHQPIGNQSFGDHVVINFGGSNLLAGTDTGTGQAFTITFPETVFVPSALQSLSLSWGATHTTFGTLQGTATVNTGGTDPEEPVDPGAELLSGKNGIAFIKGGHAWKLHYAEEPRATAPTGHRLIRTRNYDPEVSLSSIDLLGDATLFDGANRYVLTADLTIERLAPGTQFCNDKIKLLVNVGGGLGDLTSTACELDVQYNSNRGAIEGRIVSATMRNTGGDKTYTFSGGQFRVYKHQGITGAAPANLPDNAWASMAIDTGSFELASGQHFLMTRDPANISSSESYGTEVSDGTKPWGTGNASDNIAWHLRGTSFPSTGTYPCKTTAPSLQLEVWLGTYLDEYLYKTSNTGGSCSITIDQKIGSFYTGSYTATLVSTDSLLNDTQRTISVSGKLRNFRTTSFTANNGNEGTLPANTNGMTMAISNGSAHFTAGETFLLTVDEGQSSLWFNRRLPKVGSRTPPSLFDIRFFNLPSTTGTYECATDYAGKKPYLTLNTEPEGQSSLMVYQSVTFSGGQPSPLAGASCTINVTSVNGSVIEGTYTATMLIPNAAQFLSGNDNSISISGSFRHGVSAP